MQGRMLRILAQTANWVAIDKPSGFVAHPLDDPKHAVPRHQNCLAILRDQLGQLVYPVHRLDRPTSGVLIYALSPESASRLQEVWHTEAVQKRYLALVRGHITEPLVIDRPLKRPKTGTLAEASTTVIPVFAGELPYPYRQFPTLRISLVWALPHTGRFHQIRRHLAGIGHPILGDTVHGDGVTNRISRTALAHRLYLQAQEWVFHEHHCAPHIVQARLGATWHRAFDALGICPLPFNN